MSVCDQKLKDLFLQAVKSKDILKVQACLSLGVKVNHHDEEGIPALHYATAANRTVLDLFLSQPDVDVNIKESKYSSTALMVACCRGKLDAVMRLCQVPGIDLNLRTICGRTAAMFAVYHNHHDIVEYLKSLPDVDWNVKNIYGCSAIMVAVARGHAETLKVLLAIPTIDTNATDDKGRSIAQVAVKEANSSNRSLQCLELLANDIRVDWNAKDASGDTPIMYAVKKKSRDVFKILMKVPSIDITVLQDAKMDNDFLREAFKKNIQRKE